MKQLTSGFKPTTSFFIIRNNETMANFLYETRLQVVMVVIFIKTKIQSKMINKTTINP